MMNMSPMITKILLPQCPRGLLQRPRLLEFLHEHVDYRLILISASAGYGKTTLLVDFAHDTDIPLCWYSLDTMDNDPRVFVEHFIATIARHFPGFGKRSRTVLRNIERFDRQGMYPLVTALVNEMYEAIPEYFIVVLDDYHCVEDSPAINDFLSALLEHMPENCHIIVSSRTVPGGLPLVRLTARRQMAGLGVNELRFTGEEIQALIKQNYGLDMPLDKARALAEQSEGWITGILLTAQTMWKQLLEGVITTSGLGEQVYEYLASEVFAQQPEEMQEFLLASSVLTQMSPALCDALLERKDSRELLELAEERNLFIIRLEGRERWYRYHHLFREFLQARLRQQDEESFRNLHRRAGQLLAAQEVWGEAISHYMEGADYEAAAATLEAAARPMFISGQWATLTRLLDSLPPSVLEAHPRLLLSRGVMGLEAGNLDEAERYLERAYQKYVEINDKDGAARALIEKGNVYRLQGKYGEAIVRCERALDVLGEKEETIVVAEAHRIIGVCHERLGKFTEGLRHLEKAVFLFEQVSEATRRLHNIAMLHHDLGTIYEITGDLSRSLHHYQQAIRYWQELGKASSLAITLNGIGVNHYYRGEFVQALEAMQEALDKAREAGYARSEAYTLVSLGDVYRDLGDYRQALEVYQAGLEIAEKIREGFLVIYGLSALGEVYYLQGEHRQAEALVRQALELAHQHKSDYEIGLCLVPLGILQYERGDTLQAEATLTQALSLFQQSNMKRELARTHFHLAQVAFLEGDLSRVSEHLNQALHLTTVLGHDQFIIVDGQRTRPMLEYAAANLEDGERFQRLLERVEQFSRSKKKMLCRPRREEPKAPPGLKIRALGRGEVWLNSELVPTSRWVAAQTRELFFFILAHPQGLSKEQIGAVFWPDLSSAKLHSVFHAVMYRLRRAVFPECVIFEEDRYRFNTDLDYWYDVEEFERLCDKAEQVKDNLARQARFYRRAIELYRGDYLEDCYADWCLAERERLQQRFLAALENLARFYRQRKQYGQAIELYRRLLAKDPYREDIYRQVMKCHALSGDRAGIIQCYRECVRVLEEELGLEPSPETQTLYQELLHGE